MNRYKDIEVALKDFCENLSNPESDYPNRIKRMMVCIQKNLFIHELSVGWVMKQCLIRNHNISSLFLYYIGCTPSQYILRHRIAAAKRLLADPQLKDVHFSEIGYCVGFEHSSTFSKAFKRETDVTPNCWRNNHLSE